MIRAFLTSPAAFKLVMFLTGLGIMSRAESILPVRPWQVARRKRLLFHLSLSAFNSIVLRLTVFAPLMMWRVAVNSEGLGLCPMLGLKGPWEMAVSLVILDMFDYWWHRWNHRIGLLWRFHKVHHVDTHVDVTTSLRFHPGELLISSGVKAVWILLVGPSIWTFAVFEAAVTLASQFHHTNTDFGNRTEAVIRSVIVTPRYHAAHHTVKQRTGDNNFAAILIFWDKIFGTYRRPDYEEMKNLGLPRGRESYLSFASTLIGPFRSEY